MLDHERALLENSELFAGHRFANFFNKIANSGNWRTLRTRDRPNIHVSVKDKGSHIDTEQHIPVIKIELLFDPQFKLGNVVQALQNEAQRKRWDPFIHNMKVLDRSESARLIIMQTTWKPFLDIAPRYLYEKKLNFCVLVEEESKEEPNTFLRTTTGLSGLTDGENCIHYTYVSSCAEAPAIPLGKKTYAQFSKSVDTSAAFKQPQEACTLFSMQKFELIDALPQ